MQLQQFLGDQVILHHAASLYLMPPALFQRCRAAWHAPESFKPLPHRTLDTLQEHLSTAFPPALRQKYK